MNTKIQEVATLILQASKVVVFLGAGMSKESGIPTFRGEGGKYEDPKIADLPYLKSLTSKPKEVLTWYQQRRQELLEAKPNEGHLALARIMKRKSLSYTVVTQNVDDLTTRACIQEEVSNYSIYPLHGQISKLRCMDCGTTFDDMVTDLSTLPQHSGCGGLLRPDVVLFGEPLDQQVYNEATEAATEADVCLIIGTSGFVFPAARIPELARQYGATLIEINPSEDTAIDPDIHLKGMASEVLLELEKALIKE